MTANTKRRNARRPLISYGHLPTNKHALRKWEARDALRTFTALKAQSSCGAFMYAPPTTVTLPNGAQYVAGVGHCRISNSCPWCSPPKLATKRTKIIELGLTMERNGGYCIMATLTLRNVPNQPLGAGYRNLESVRSKFRRKLKAIELKYGVYSSVCVLEETFTSKKRWNPHYHWAWVVPGTMTLQKQKAFEAEVLKAWLDSAALVAMTPVSVKAQSFTAFHGPQAIKNMAYYMMKHALYPEMAPPRHSDGGSRGLAPFDILEMARFTGDMYWIQAYNEFEHCNKGRHRVRFYTNGGTINRKPIRSQPERKHG